MSKFLKVKNSLAKLVRAVGLCHRGQEVLEAWLQAVMTNDPADYNMARYYLVMALHDRVERLVIVAPLLSWKTSHLNILVFHPYYEEYAAVQKKWIDDIPQLPLHVPIELEAGIGPYTTGRHLVLFLDSSVPHGEKLPHSMRLSLELMNTWYSRLRFAIDWLAPIAEPAIQACMKELINCKSLEINAILESILAHEIGHVHSLWPVFPQRPNFELVAVVPTHQRSRFQTACSALADIAADIAHTATATRDSLLITVSYHLLNLLSTYSYAGGFSLNLLQQDSDFLAGCNYSV
jgi:hypothetical protein